MWILTKRLSLILGVITLAIGGSYYLTGKLIEKNYINSITKINAQPNIKVNLLSYKRGFFSSTAEVTLEVGTNNSADMQIIPLQQAITHGPIIIANAANGPQLKLLVGQIKTFLGEPWQTNLKNYTQNLQPLTITTLVNFSNQATTWLKLASIDQTTPSKFHVNWSEITGSMQHDLHFENYQGKINCPNILIEKPEWKFTIDNFVLSLDANKQNANYSSHNILSTKNIRLTKQGRDIIKLDDVISNITLFLQDNNLALNAEAKIANSQIVDQNFADDTLKLQVNNINRKTLSNLPRISALSPKGTIDLIQQITAESTALTLELPKHFTEAMLSYFSFEIYRISYLGKFDRRPEQEILKDITGGINKLVQGAVKQNLFIDKGKHYALNFQTNNGNNNS